MEAHIWSERPNYPTVLTGVDGIRRIAARFTDKFDELRWDRELVIDVGGDRVVALFHQRGRSKTDGTWVEVQVAGIFYLRDGKVVEVQNYPSWDEALEASRQTT